MILACITVYLVMLLAAGYALFCAIAGPGRRNGVEVFAVSAALGAGAVGLLLIWISMLGALPGRPVFGAIAVTILASVILLHRSGKLIVPIIDFDLRSLLRREWLSLIPLAVIVYLVLVAIDRAFTLPILEWDAYAIWQLKAKVLATHTLWSSPSYFHDVSLSYSHLRYPLLFPMLTAGAYGMAGSLDELAAKCVLPLLYATTGALVYAGIRPRGGRAVALVCAAMLMALPGLLRWSDVGIADLPLACFYAASILFVIRWLENRQRSDLILATLFSGFAAMTKNEGIALAVINAVVLLLPAQSAAKRQSFFAAMNLVVGVIILILPWMFWSHGLPRTDEDYSSRLSASGIVENLPRVGYIIRAITTEMLQWNHWGVFWLLPLLLLLINPRSVLHRAVAGTWLLLILQLAAYVFIYVIAPGDWKDLIKHTADRLLLHAAPAAALLIGWEWRLCKDRKFANPPFKSL